MHYRFLKGRGKVCPWILWWVCHHQGDLARSWWWWIDLARWHTSIPPRKVSWPKRQKGCYSHKCSSIMASPRTLCRIETQSSQASFGEPCGSAWGWNWRWTPHSNPKLMDKLREWTWLSTIPKELCGSISTRLSGPFGVGRVFGIIIRSI